MVDAINAVNAATNTKIRLNQDLSKDWRAMSAEEVLEHAGKGEDVPLEVLQWAEDYSKMTNVPDNVTYDAVNGATNSTEVREEYGASDKKSAEEAADDSEEVSDEAEGQEEISLYDQAGILIPQSQAATSDVNEMTADVNTKADESEKMAETATQRAEQVENNTASIRNEYDTLLNQLLGDKSKINPADLLKLDRLSNRLTQTGIRAQSELSVYDIQLQEIEQEFAQYETLPPTAVETGNETTDVGVKLIANSPQAAEDVQLPEIESESSNFTRIALQKANLRNWTFMFDRNYAMGVRAVEAGTDATDAGTVGASTLESGQATVESGKAAIEEASDRVEGMTFVKGNNIRLDKSNENSGTDDERKQRTSSTSSSTANRTDVNGVKEADIQANDLELKRRRELRGEYDAT